MANWVVESYRPGGAKEKECGGCDLRLQSGGRHSHGDGKANVRHINIRPWNTENFDQMGLARFITVCCTLVNIQL